MSIERWAAPAILAIGLVGLLIALQGWRARGPDTDVIAAMVRAVALVERGHVPQRGTLTDLHSFRPPGTSWLAAPGLWSSDPRLVELTGSTLLYLGSLAAVFVLGRYCVGSRAALLATALYGISSIALTLATQLMPKGHPLFCVWMVYCAARWVSERQGRWLAAATIVWAAGMYVHMEMAPFIFMLPPLWWVFRPPVPARPLLAAAIVILVMWSPYLAFERTRAFIDVRSQLLLRPLQIDALEAVAWCGHTPAPNPRFAAPAGAAPVGLGQRVATIAGLTLVTFETRVPGGALILLVLLAGGLAVLSGVPVPWWMANRRQPRAGVLAIAIVVPWLILLVVTDAHGKRALGLWPLQAIAIAAFVTNWSERQPQHAIRRWALTVAVLVIVAANPTVLQRGRAWLAGGWSGVTPESIYASDFRTVRCEDEP